ncbi:NAD-dependent succinate-semialdehyde dehydrogenase [Thiohalorhabdus methylotrophus]|uniref:NAD-dependent succinate-semialdehyde dehydrogenase n=1 Tax=Thiohalorhabdus methylotrophus TaxID=3242694 RepID=A0ABV4TWD7_9GAMM
MVMESINPATEEVLDVFEELTDQQLETALEASRQGHEAWARASFSHRRQVLEQAGRLLRQEADAHARMITREMGKPVGEARGEVEKCAWACDYYAEQGERFLAPEPVDTDASRSYVRYAPLGPVLAVMPWNFPFWQVFRAAAPTLMAGNAMLLKHASNVPACAAAIEGILAEAGLPQGVFQNLPIGSGRVEGVINDPRVRAVTLTGSETAGRKVAAAAGSALKKTVLELGGSDPFLVLEDADLDEAARLAATARNINSGQSCIAAKRFIVVDTVADAFVERLRARLAELPVGDPTAPETRIGPQARGDLRDTLHRQVRDSVKGGARLLLGGEIPGGKGFFYPPTLLDGVTEEMPVAREETFGPVAPVLRVPDEEAAVALANHSRYGLGGAVWSGDRERAEAVGQRLDVGCVFINGMVKSDPRLPFGGVKASGYGRELGQHGIREFTNIQSVWIG